MPIAQNRLYNDPALGQAFSNLANVFAPPSGSDLAGYASAQAKREEAARLAELFNYAKDPNYDQARADRMGVLGGLYAPTQSYYSVNLGDQTTRRGQDVTAATSRANNAADNIRALEANRADNTRAMQLGALENQRSAITSLYGALNPGQIRPEVPADIASRVGLPALPQIAGTEKPLTDAELKAQILNGLPANEQRAAALSGVDVERVVGDNGVAEIVMRPDAVGRQPYIAEGSKPKAENAIAVMPDGQQVPALQGPDGRWVHAQTGAPLPASIRLFDLPKATGTAADVGLAPTTANNTAANNQEAEVTRALNLLDIYQDAVTSNPGSLGLAGLVRGTAQNAAQTAVDLAQAFGKSAPQVAEAANEIRAGLQGVAPEFFDQSIPEIEFLQGTLAYSLARTENPSGEVSRQAFERALDRVKGGGMLANKQSALAAIDANRKVLQTQLEGIRTLRAPGSGRTDTGFQPPAGSEAPVEKWDIVNGKLQRVQ